ncbi:hypothetical protein MTBBW1_300117 [Desulfamplus magnetovallimortis]|uniref:Uncharacterized protein n=1 Tax=Desulfamplus magnetovallimortis TaxID=1246637 RepID=A0A1W1HG20_9BACT|nr:hypothetical protein MTBBW1_300117 [Desulfamplus magnetovallimortis]
MISTIVMSIYNVEKIPGNPGGFIGFSVAHMCTVGSTCRLNATYPMVDLLGKFH